MKLIYTEQFSVISNTQFESAKQIIQTLLFNLPVEAVA